MALERTIGHVAVLGVLLCACTSGSGQIVGRSGNGTDPATSDPYVQPPTRSASEPPGGCVACDMPYVCTAPSTQTGSSSGFGSASSSGQIGSSGGAPGGLGGLGTTGNVPLELVLKTQADGTCGTGLLRFACGGEILLGSLPVGTWTAIGAGFVLGTAKGALTCEPGAVGILQPSGVRAPDAG